MLLKARYLLSLTLVFENIELKSVQQPIEKQKSFFLSLISFHGMMGDAFAEKKSVKTLF